MLGGEVGESVLVRDDPLMSNSMPAPTWRARVMTSSIDAICEGS